MPYQQGYGNGAHGAYQALSPQMYQSQVSQDQNQHTAQPHPMVLVPGQSASQQYQALSPQMRYNQQHDGLPNVQVQQQQYPQPRPYELSSWQQSFGFQHQQQHSLVDMLEYPEPSQYHTVQSQPQPPQSSYQACRKQGYTNAPQTTSQHQDQRPSQGELQPHQQWPRQQGSARERQPSQTASNLQSQTSPHQATQTLIQLIQQPTARDFQPTDDAPHAGPVQTSYARQRATAGPAPSQAESVQSTRPVQPTENPQSMRTVSQASDRRAQRPSLHASAQPTPQRQRHAAYVSIPVQRPFQQSLRGSELTFAQSDGPSSPKRQRSNDGNAVPVCEAPPSMPPSHTPNRVTQPSGRGKASHGRPTAPQYTVSSSPLSGLLSSQIPATPPQPPVDNQAVLLTLADEYVTAAHSMSSALVASTTEEDYEHYHALLSTALGCYESVLNNYRHPDARKEARLRLKYAVLLYEETENAMECEEILSKGIALCDRSRLNDLKYSMHHLMARVTFRTSSKAALKATEKLVSETEKLGLPQWVYCFRFLRVSLSLQLPGSQDTSAMLRHLAAVSALADAHGHVSVQIVAATLEAIVHLRNPAADAVELAQRSLAAVRTHQLSPEMAALPQVRALLDCLDLACSLAVWTPQHAEERLKQMQNNLDAATRDGGWGKNGAFYLPLVLAVTSDLEVDTGGLLKGTNDGRAALQFQWLPRSNLYAVGFLLSGYASMIKNSENGKAEIFLKEGMKITKTPFHSRFSSMAELFAMKRVQNVTSTALGTLHVWALCSRSAWQEAEEALATLHMTHLISPHDDLDDLDSAVLSYLAGMIQQGQGNLTIALAKYSASSLALQREAKTCGTLRDLRTLAALNSIMILRIMGENEKAKAEVLLGQIENECLQHCNKALLSAYYIMKSTCFGMGPSTGMNDPNHPAAQSIIKTKQYLQLALAPAQRGKDTHLLAVIMNTMTQMFFSGVVGGQAEKSAGAGRSLAKKTQNKLWIAVADGMYADVTERVGKATEAALAYDEAEAALRVLPEKVREHIARLPLEG